MIAISKEPNPCDSQPEPCHCSCCEPCQPDSLTLTISDLPCMGCQEMAAALRAVADVLEGQ